jgi:hypothetical protein
VRETDNSFSKENKKGKRERERDRQRERERERGVDKPRLACGDEA